VTEELESRLDGVIEKINEYLLEHTESSLAADTGVSLHSLRLRLKEEGIDFKARREHCIRLYIRENYRIIGAAEMEAKLKIGKKYIYKRAKDMGLRFPTGGDRRSDTYREKELSK